MLERLAQWCVRRRRFVVVGWVAGLIVLTVLGSTYAGKFSNNAHLPNTESQQAFDLLRHDIAHDHLVSELRETGARHEADPPRAEDRERFLRLPGHAPQRRGRSPRAIAIIVSFESASSRVFTTQ